MYKKFDMLLIIPAIRPTAIQTQYVFLNTYCFISVWKTWLSFRLV